MVGRLPRGRRRLRRCGRLPKSRYDKQWSEDTVGNLILVCIFWPLALLLLAAYGLIFGGRFLCYGFGSYLGSRAKLRAERPQVQLSSTLDQLAARWAAEARAEVDRIVPNV